MTKSAVLLLGSLLLYQFCLAGAWTRNKGQGYQQVSFTYLKYSSLINGDDEGKKMKRAVTDYTIQHYLEYGLRDNLTLTTVLPFKMLSTDQDLANVSPEDDIFPFDTVPSGELSGLSNLSIALKYRLINKGYVLSTQLKIGTATFSYQEETGLRTGYDSWLITPTFLFGKGWKGKYLTSELGYQFKTNNYANNLIANVEYGMSLEWKKTKTWVAFILDAVVPIDVGSFDDGNAVHTGLYRNGEGYVSPGIKINHYLNKKLIFNFGTYGAIWADHGGAAPTYNFGFAYEW